MSFTIEDKKARWALPQDLDRAKAGEPCSIPGCDRILKRDPEDGRAVCGECRLIIDLGMNPVCREA